MARAKAMPTPIKKVVLTILSVIGILLFVGFGQ